MVETSNKNTADSQFIWTNGEFKPYEDSKVHVLSHSLHYGTAVFEGIRAYLAPQGKTFIFKAKEHYQRFQNSIDVMGYSTPYTVDEWVTATKELIKKNEFKECYIRPIAYLDDSIRGLKLPTKPKAQVTIATWNWGKYLGSSAQTTGIKTHISRFRRQDTPLFLNNAKISGGYLLSVLARKEATAGGFDEALLLDPKGFVAEGSGENIFIVKNGELFTPTPRYILPGITRNSVIEIANSMEIKVTERDIKPEELYLADEVFFTGTAVEVTAIRQIDDKTIGSGKPGPITQRLSKTFFSTTIGESQAFQHWITEVS